MATETLTRPPTLSLPQWTQIPETKEDCEHPFGHFHRIADTDKYYEELTSPSSGLGRSRHPRPREVRPARRKAGARHTTL